MTRLTLFGAGKIGEAIIHLLGRTGDYTLRVVDSDPHRLAPMEDSGAECVAADIRDAAELARLVKGQDVVMSACPFFLTPAIAKAARAEGAHYLDLTEDVESTRVVMGLADNWLRHVQDVHSKHDQHVAMVQDLGKRIDRLCELNVIEQVANVCQTTIVRDAWERGQALTVHGWIYGLHDGLVRDLDTTVTRPGEAAPAYQAAIASL